MNMRTDVWIRKVGQKQGKPYLYLDSLDVLRANFVPGARYNMTIDGDNKRVVLTLNADGSRTVSRKTRQDKELPVIDINSAELKAAFEGIEAVRVIVQKDRIVFLPLASELKKAERYDRIRRKLTEGETLLMGSLSHGGGILSHAIHTGLKDGGIDCELAFANEIRDDLLEQAITHNDAWSKDTATLAVPMQELTQDDWLMQHLPKLDILEMGLPCSGASKAGSTKRKLAKMEDHSEVGHLAFSALMILMKTQPAVALLENVPEYADSASAQILRLQLRDMGYNSHEAILSGKDFGCLENRIRWCLIATTKGLDFSFDHLAPRVTVVRKLGDVLQPIGPLDARWCDFAYLKAKEDRDLAAGKGFKMQTVTPKDSGVPTLRKGYHKGGSTDPLLKHPTSPELLRKFTSTEHARIKGVPDHLIAGLSETTAHQLLGQGIVYAPFQAVAQRVANSLLTLAEQTSVLRPKGDDDGPEGGLARKQRAVG